MQDAEDDWGEKPTGTPASTFSLEVGVCLNTGDNEYIRVQCADSSESMASFQTKGVKARGTFKTEYFRDPHCNWPALFPVGQMTVLGHG